jgi:hypothetical protein
MNRTALVIVASLLTLVDVAIHLRRSLVPDGNPFSSALHEQFFLYCAVAVLLVIGVLTAPRWLAGRAWLLNTALIVWELGAIGVWLVAYHGPNPTGLLPDEGYVAKTIEAIVVILLVVATFAPRERTLASGT